MTANLLNGMADAGHLTEVLDRVRPDVIVTQKMGPDLAEVIASRYPTTTTTPISFRRAQGSLAASMRSSAPSCAAMAFWQLGQSGHRIQAAHSCQRPHAQSDQISLVVIVRGRTDQLDALFLWTDRTIRNEAVAAAG